MKQRGLWVIVAVFLVGVCPAMAADDPLAGVGQLLFAKKTAEARTAIEQARKIYVDRQNPAGQATADLLLGMTDAVLKKIPEARAELDMSAAEFTALGDSFGAWMSVWTLAELERQQGDLQAAIVAHERGLRLLHDASVSDAPFTAESLKALALVFGVPEEAVAPLIANSGLLRPMLLQMAEMFARDAYGAILMEAGALDKADEQLTRASELSTMYFGMFDAPIGAHLGDLRRRQWRFEDARKSYLKALGGAKMLPNLPVNDAWGEFDILGKLADIDMLSGSVEESLAWNDRALKLARASSPSRELGALADRGSLLARAGRVEDAKHVLNDALKLAASRGDDSWRASILANLGGLALMEGAYGTAASQLEKSIELYQKLDEPYVEAPIWITLAEVYLLLEQRGSAALALTKARDLARKSKFKLAEGLVNLIIDAEKSPDRNVAVATLAEAFAKFSETPGAADVLLSPGTPELMRDLAAVTSGRATPGPSIGEGAPPLFRGMASMLKGYALVQRGNFSGARAVFQEGLALNPSRDLRAGYLALIGATYWREGNRNDAIAFFENAANALDTVVDDVKVEEMVAGFLGSDRHVYYDLLISMLVKDGGVEKAFEMSERARARAFLQVIGNRRLNAEHGGDPALVREAETLRAQIPEWEKTGARARGADAVRIASDLKFARERYASLEARIKVSNPEYAALTLVEPLRLADLRTELPDDVTLVSYFVSGNETHAWVIDRGSVHYTLLPLSSDDLRRIGCWAAAFTPVRDTRGVSRINTKCSDAATSDDVYTWLFAPLRQHVRSGRLIVIPHGMLHYIPFAAVHDPVSGHYLIEDYVLSYAPSASSLRFLRAKETPVNGGALVLGDPVSATPVAGRLPGAQDEAVVVGRHLGVAPILGAQARESLLRTLGGKVDVLHIAAHAFYDPANPLFSRVALAPGDGDDGNLEVHEILSRIDLSGVNLVVLSACQTAVGERSAGDEIVGLTRALLYAGASGVVSTLWNIDDASSARLMDEFYRHFVAGERAADALRAAQLEISRSARYHDPRYWAAFTLTGAPQAQWIRTNPAP